MRLLAAAEGAEFHVPTIAELFEWVPFATYKLAGITFHLSWMIVFLFATVALLTLIWVIGFANFKLVPSGLQNFLEVGVDFVRENIVHPTIGPEGERFMPFLTSMFFFVFSLNVLGIIPGIQFPITSRMAFPAFLALLSYVLFLFVGIRSQGFGHYFGGIMFPSGVPKPIYLILTPVEVLSTLIFRPLTLAVRLFANMVAGHVMLAIFFGATAYFLLHGEGILLRVLSPFPFVMSIILVGFELFIAGIQAFIFTILTAVYIAGAMHPEH
ncbi:MAG TPA: F0F1 ATP synthase subunit A [Actinomycetota bacterium]|nr:F0F1 ATP synthase subunit A [Actinomycetota bacterium]